MTFRWFGRDDPVPLAHIRHIPGVSGVVSALYDASSGGAWQSRRYQVHVVDRVSGGDSFAAALIAALAADRDPADAVQFAAAAGALKLTIPGDWNRATPEEIEQLVRACT